ncbi:MAG TPA: urease accessory UreF family protein [Nitrospiria bacterium]
MDAFFPSGGYAHSFGLETAVQEGAIRTGDDLGKYLFHALKEGAARSDGVAVSASHRGSAMGDLESIVDADHTLEALKPCRETREASRRMGRQVFQIGADRFPHPVLREITKWVVEDRTPGHYPVAMGVTLCAAGWPEKQSVSAYLYQSITGAVSAALRLMPLGQREAQEIIHGLLPTAAALAEGICGRGPQEMTAWTPLHEIRAMRHARLESRLFRS